MINPSIEIANKNILYIDKLIVKLENYHGHMLKILSPLPKDTILFEVVKRVGMVFAAIIAYPAWGLLLLAKQCMSFKPVQGLSTHPSNSISSEIKQKIIQDLKLWNLYSAYKGDKVRIYGHYEICDLGGHEDLGGSWEYVSNSNEAFMEFKNKVIKWLDTHNEFDNQSKVNIQILIVGKLDKIEDGDDKVEIVDYQLFKQSYVGLQGSGYLGLPNLDTKETFLKQAASIIGNKAIWDNEGNFID